MREYMIDMYDIWKSYPNGVYALKGVNIKIDRGEFVYLVGPSGAGKSTFMKLIYREETPTKGEIFVNNLNMARIKKRKIPLLRRDIGIVFQDYRLLPKLSTYENVAFAMEATEASRKLIRKRVPEVLTMVGLKDKMESYPDQLSGGEQQRVAIARALANNPSVVIADEPTGNLDQDTSWDIMKIFEEINSRGTTVVMATHNREIVNNMRKRLIVIEDGQVVRDEEQGGLWL